LPAISDDTKLADDDFSFVEHRRGVGPLVGVDPDEGRCVSSVSSHAATKTGRATRWLESQPNRQQGSDETAHQAPETLRASPQRLHRSLSQGRVGTTRPDPLLGDLGSHVTSGFGSAMPMYRPGPDRLEGGVGDEWHA